MGNRQKEKPIIGKNGPSGKYIFQGGLDAKSLAPKLKSCEKKEAFIEYREEAVCSYSYNQNV